MTVGGRPRKPTEEKRRLGNPGKRPLPSKGQVVELAEVVPLEVERSPVTVIADVLSAGAVWLAETDVALLALLRESIEERAELRELVMSVGDPADRRSLRDLDKQIVGMLSSLGFDPSARSRLGLAEVKRVSKLDELKAKHGRS
jgi:hypothetical protein